MGRRRQAHEAAWHYLLTHLETHIALVQEALASASRVAADHGSLVWSGPRAGGTGVFVRDGVDFERLEMSLKGSYLAGISTGALGGGIRAFSIHVGPESWNNQKTLEPWLISQVNDGMSIIGGDFNISRRYSRKHQAYFDRLLKAGVHDCHWAKNGREVPSFWGRQSLAAIYQDDHFFASPSLAGLVRDCQVVDNPLTRLLSDHGPVVLDLESPPD
jgi:endonuclease/exonuclease/phosphatase family metal-dependent hydrolase